MLVAGLLAAAALAAVSLAVSGVPMIAKAIVSIVAAVYFAIALRRFLIDAPVRVVWQAPDNWRIVDRGGRESDAALIRSTVRGEWILIELRRANRARVAIVLAPDNTDAETRRALRVRMARQAQ